MKKLLFLFVFCSFSSIFAQNSFKAVKISTGLDWGNEEKYGFSYSDFNGTRTVTESYSSDFDFISFAPAIIKFKNNHFKSFEITALRAKHSDYLKTAEVQIISQTQKANGYSILEAKLGFRYEYGYNLFPSDKGDGLYIGIGVRPYLNFYRNVPKLSDDFPRSFANLGVSLDLSPHWIEEINNQLYWDLSFTVSAANYRLSYSNLENPTLPIEEQITFLTHGDFFKNYQFRFGIGYKFGQKQAKS